MGHYECKECGQRYDSCTCPVGLRAGLPRTVEKGTGKPLAVKKARRKTDKVKPVLEMVNTRIDELQDFGGELYVLEASIKKLIGLYGPRARIHFDAGHNNVSVIVEHRPARYGTLATLPDAALTGEVSLTVGIRYAISEENTNGELLIETDAINAPIWLHRSRLENISDAKELL